MKMTLEMVIAGSAELAGRQEDDTDEVCQDVFEAMMQAAGIQTPIARLPQSQIAACRLERLRVLSQIPLLPDRSSVSFSVDEKESVAIGPRSSQS